VARLAKRKRAEAAAEEVVARRLESITPDTING
jgi:hypothetical protein